MPIFDQGYQHWNGTLSGHAWRWLAVTRQGIRAILSNWLIRILLLLAWMPALVLVSALAIWGMLEQGIESVLALLSGILPAGVVQDPATYRSAIWTIAYSIYFKTELFVVFCVVLIVGPNLISRDLRFNALPLYLSRPLRRIDYFIGKLGVIAFFIAAVVIAPTFLAYVFGVAFSLNLSIIWDTQHLLWASLAYGAIIVVSVGTLMLALSSLSRRSIFVGLMWVGFWLITTTVSGILIGIEEGTARNETVRAELKEFVAANPPPEGVRMHDGVYPIRRRGRRDGTPDENKEYREWMRKWSMAHSIARAKARREQNKDSGHDWRPLCSYSANLDRMADMLLDTDTAWVTIGKAVPRAMMAGQVGDGDERFLADQMVEQYPWWWSAAILAGLLGVSLWILLTRVKSLDRLK